MLRRLTTGTTATPVATLLLASLAIGSVLTAPAAAQRVSLVWDGDSEDDDGGVSASVNARRDTLERLGFPVRIDNPNNAESWWDAYGVTELYDVLYISGEADVDALADKLRDHATPVIYETPEMDDNFGLSDTAGTETTGTQVTIDTVAHPVTSTVFLGAANVYTANNPIALLQGTPAVSLTALGNVGGQTAIAVVESGGALANTVDGNATAAARRIRLPFGGEGVNWSETTGSTQNLLEQAVLWAADSSYMPSGVAGTCVLLTESDGTLSEQETWRVRRLAYDGWAVVLLWDGDSQANYDAAIAAADVVYAAASADASDIGDKLRDCTIGVVSELATLDDNLGFATSEGSVANTSAYRVVDRTHAITANFLHNQGVSCFHRHDYAANNWPGINQNFGRLGGTLAPGLQVLGEQWSLPVLAVIETGGELANNVNGNTTAAGRRVRLPWVGDCDIRYMRSWTAGSQTWYNALRWASGTQTGTLVAHYKLDETSGSTATDSSGNGYDGTYNGGVTQNITPAPRSVAANFDAGGEHVYADPNADFQNLAANNADFTVAFWIRTKPLSHATWRNVLHIGGATSSDRGPLIMINPTLRRPYMWVSTTAVATGTGGYGASPLEEGEWTHLAVVKSGNFARWYYNGQFDNVVSIAGQSLATAGQLRIGRDGWWGSVDADLDDVRVYSYALSDQEVAEVHADLVAHYKLDETSGTVASDSSIFGNDGTLVSSPVWYDDAPIEGGLDFETSDGADRVEGPALNVGTDGVTMAAWFRQETATNDARIIANSSGNSSGQQSWMITVDESGELDCRFRAGGVWDRLQAPGVASPGVWHHGAATYDGTTMRLYLDGSLVAEEAHSAGGTLDFNAGHQVTLGDSLSGGRALDGQIDDARIYNRALSDTEIFELGGNGLRFHLKLDESSGTVAEDSSPFGIDAPVDGGSPTWIDAVKKGGASFDGNDTFATTDTFDPPATGAVAFWMRRSARPVSMDRLFGVGGDWEVRQESDGLLAFDLGVSPYTGYSDFRTLEPVGDDGRWVHVAANFDATDDSYEIYLNGTLHRATTHSRDMTAQSSGTLTIGDRTGANEPYTGELDDLRIYGRTLSAEEVADLYGLVGHWRLDEIAGDTVLYDETSFAQHGEYERTPLLEEESPYPSDAVKTAVRFEPGDYAEVHNANHLELGHENADFSVAYWLKNNLDHSGQWRETVKKHAHGWRRTPSMWLRPSDNRLHCRISTEYSFNEGTDTVATFEPGVWRHVAYVKRDSQLVMYVDGVVDKTVNLSGATVSNSGDFYMGVRGTTWRHDVTIDDVRVYSRALNDWEVAELHGLVGWYRMEDMAGSVVTDSSGIGNHAVVIGATPSWPVDSREGSGSIELNGSNYIEAPDLPVHGPGAAVSGWAKLTNTDSLGSEVVSLGDSLAIRLDSPTSGTRAFAYNGAWWEFTSAGQSFKDAGWRHFAASYRSDLRELSFYIDGVLVEAKVMSADLDLASLASTVTIGTHGDGKPGYDYFGMIDDVRVYNRPISRAEARALYYGEAVPGLRIVQWFEAPNP